MKIFQWHMKSIKEKKILCLLPYGLADTEFSFLTTQEQNLGAIFQVLKFS